ncbi:NACHT domain-containing protein [Streptomyces sp. NPDC004646]
MRAWGPARAALAEALRAGRLRGGLRQGEVAAAIGYSSSSVSLFERGNRIPPFGVMAPYAMVLSIEPGELATLWRTAMDESGRGTSLDAQFESLYAAFILENRREAEENGLGMPLFATHVSRSVFSSGDDGPMVALEGVLAERRRVVLRGAAGSGKTALLLRIAADAARKIPREHHSPTGTLVPFLFRLAAFDGGRRLPKPVNFLRGHIGQPIPHEPPVDWSERVLSAGRGLLLVDGLDEVPPEDRDRVRTWLSDVLSVYPDTTCLVTTRPAAVSGSWLEHLGFDEFSLGPMSTGEIRQFVGHWYEAMKREGDARAVERRRDELLGVLDTNTALRALVTDPAMCALVCRQFHEGNMRLPLSRAALCQAALSSDLRLAGRGTRPELDVGEAELTRILQGIAVFMQRNGLGEVSRKQAFDQIRLVLSTLPEVEGRAAPEDVLQRFLDRRGLFTACGWDGMAFGHQVFQSYLAAREFLDSGSLTDLIRSAHEEAWRNVVVFAVVAAQPRERDGLIREILRRGDTEPDHRTYLWLVAAEAVREAPLLGPRLLKEVKERTARLVPPRSFEEAAALAYAGPRVIDLLPGPDDIPPDHPSLPFLLRTAELVGGEIADAYRARFVTRRPVASEEEPQFSRVDHLNLAPLVLERWTHDTTRRRDAIAPVVELTGTEGPVELAALLEDGARRVVCRGHVPVMGVLREVPELHTLVIVNTPSLTDLGEIARLPRLRTLVISRCPHLADLGGLEESGVMFLELDIAVDDEMLAGLASAPRLRALYLPSVGPGFDPARLGRRLPGVAVLDGLHVRD